MKACSYVIYDIYSLLIEETPGRLTQHRPIYFEIIDRNQYDLNFFPLMLLSKIVTQNLRVTISFAIALCSLYFQNCICAVDFLQAQFFINSISTVQMT